MTEYKEGVIERAIIRAMEMAGLHTQRQVVCPAGIIDVLTDEKVIEVKRQLDRSSLIRAIGQLHIYGLFYPDHKREIWGLWHEDVTLFRHLCEPLGIKIESLEEWEIATWIGE